MPARLVSLQYLRAAVALMVVLHHLPVQLHRIGYRGHWPELFNSRVDIFFVLSGFILWVATTGRQDSPLAFMRRRLIRVVPLYWLATAFVVLTMLASPGLVQTGHLDLMHVLASFLFLPQPHPVASYMAPVLIPGWTLNYEVFFYIVLAACLPLAGRARLAAVALVLSAAVVAGPLIAPRAGGLAPMVEFYSAGLILEFALGMAVGAVFTSGQTLQRMTCCVLMVGGIAVLIIGPEASTTLPRVFAYGVPSALLLTGIVFFERAHRIASWPFAVRLGQASYALFVTHGIVLSALGQAWSRAGWTAYPMFVLTALGLCTASAFVVHRFVEQPMTNWLRDRTRSVARPAPLQA